MLTKRILYNFIKDTTKFNQQQFDKFKSQRYSTVGINAINKNDASSQQNCLYRMSG